MRVKGVRIGRKRLCPDSIELIGPVTQKVEGILLFMLDCTRES